MKTKLLRKAKKEIKIYKRNKKFYVVYGSIEMEHSNIESARRNYRNRVISRANEIFGFKPKSKIR